MHTNYNNVFTASKISTYFLEQVDMCISLLLDYRAG